MKKIVSLFAVAVALLTANIANAQTDIHAGYITNNVVTTTTILSNNFTDTATTPGFYAGLSHNINLTGNLNVSVGLNAEYYQQGDTLDILGMAGVASKTQMLDLSLPVQLNYGLNLGSDLKLTLFAGPTFYFGLINRTQYHGTVLGVSKDWTTDWFENSDQTTEEYYVERFKMAATVGASLNYRQIGFQAGYTQGLTDMSSSDNVKSTFHRIFFGLSYTLK